MNLKKGMAPCLFLDQVRQCRGDVLFCTTQGDVLNLKSALSQLVFAAASEDKELFYTAQVVCKNESDEEMLEKFMEK